MGWGVQKDWTTDIHFQRSHDDNKDVLSAFTSLWKPQTCKWRHSDTRLSAPSLNPAPTLTLTLGRSGLLARPPRHLMRGGGWERWGPLGGGRALGGVGAEASVSVGSSRVRREGNEGVLRSPSSTLVLRSMFFSLSCFLAERTVILPVDFLILLHPSVLQSVLGGRSYGAELWFCSILKNNFYNTRVERLNWFRSLSVCCFCMIICGARDGNGENVYKCEREWDR